jgi:hypothetical protein
MSRPRKDLTGQTFNRLTVLRLAETARHTLSLSIRVPLHLCRAAPPGACLRGMTGQLTD